MREFETKTYDIPLPKNEILPDEELQLEEEAHLEVDRNYHNVFHFYHKSDVLFNSSYLSILKLGLSRCHLVFTNSPTTATTTTNVDDVDDADDNVDDDVR